MADLATTADVEARLGRDLSAAESDRAAALLADASATVRGYTGQQFTQATTTERLRIRRGRVLLPQRPTTAVSAVADLAGNPVFHEWDGIDRVKVAANVPSDFSFVPWTSSIQVVDVTYTHGYTTIPDDVVSVVCSIVSRAFGVDPTATSVSQQVAGPFSQTFGSAGAAGSLGLLPAEKVTLDRYRSVGGYVQTGP